MLQGERFRSSCLVAVASSNLNNMLKGTMNVSVVLEEAEKLPEEEYGMQHGWLPWDCPWWGTDVRTSLWRELK